MDLRDASASKKPNIKTWILPTYRQDEKYWGSGVSETDGRRLPQISLSKTPLTCEEKDIYES